MGWLSTAETPGENQNAPQSAAFRKVHYLRALARYVILLADRFASKQEIAMSTRSERLHGLQPCARCRTAVHAQMLFCPACGTPLRPIIAGVRIRPID
ncbi:MAG TPA: zinc ribbon domain-containing protein, partial [Nitrososphaera sp.]|nr:zinc ribbon domain-containing protein [Nitrososphaera sp.]